MLDHTIPSEVRLSWYLSARFLQELQLALQLIGVPSAYVRPGIEGVVFPRLYVGFTEDELETFDATDKASAELDEFICAVPFTLNEQCRSWTDPDPEWWFMWWGDQTLPICQATDMKHAALVIAEQLYGESA
jgi:hypothetical protein